MNYLSQTYQTLKELHICGVQPTQRGFKGGKSSVLNINTETSRPAIQEPITNDSTSTLNLSLWNSQSVGNKPICEYVTDRDIDILCLTETWLRKDDPVVIGEISPPGYSFINVPRNSNNHRGGVGILYKSQLSLGQVTNQEFPDFHSFEYTIVSNMSHSMSFDTSNSILDLGGS